MSLNHKPFFVLIIMFFSGNANSLEENIVVQCSRDTLNDRPAEFALRVDWKSGNKSEVEALRFYDIRSGTRFYLPYLLNFRVSDTGALIQGIYLHSGVVPPSKISVKQDPIPFLEVRLLRGFHDRDTITVVGKDYSRDKDDFHFGDCELNAELFEGLNKMSNTEETFSTPGHRSFVLANGEQ